MTEDFTFDEDLRRVSIAFFIAKRPIHRLEIDWFRFWIDGEEVPAVQTGALPADQGIWVLLGMFEEGRTFELKWSFRTGIEVPDDDQVVLGHFPDGRLTKATRFERLTLERFRDYDGVVSVTVTRP